MEATTTDMHPGPRDPSLLHLQSVHRSTEIWRVGGGDAQRCRRRNPNQTRLPDLHHRMLPLLQSTGFYGIARVSSLQLDWGLITALVERWRSETHTFHLPLGECTITLQDVGILVGLPVDGDPVIGVTPRADMSWADVVASVFGHLPSSNRFNGARLQLSWFDDIVPKKLEDNASEEELRHYTKSYLLQLIAGSMFTDHSGGLVHCMWIPYLQDLDTCGRYAWGAAVLSFLYRELCKSCRIDREEIAGCLILLQLWAWERLPTIAPLRTNRSFDDAHFWAGQLPGPHGVRWLVHHSFTEKNGRTVAVYRAVLDELGPAHFIWEPYPLGVIDALPAYCLSGMNIWHYRGPLICVFIVEPHMADRVFRQFGMLQTIPVDAEYSSALHKLTLQGNTDVNWVQKHQPSINIWNSRLDYISESELIVGDGVVPEYHDWYVRRTRRFHTRMGALHTYIGDLLKTIAERTSSVLPDVSDLAIQGWHNVQQRSLHGVFEAYPVDERRDKEKEGRQLDGRRPKRVGHKGGRGGARSVRCRTTGAFVDVPTPQGEGVFDDDHGVEHLGDDHESVLKEGSYGQNVGESEINAQPPHSNQCGTEYLRDDHELVLEEGNYGQNIGESEINAQPTHGNQGDLLHPMQNPIQKHVQQPSDSLLPMQEPIQQSTVEPIQQRIKNPVQQPTDEYPTFNLGLTPGGSLLPTPPEPIVEPIVESIQQPIQNPVQEPTDWYPTFNLGLTPGGSLLPTPPEPIVQPIVEPFNQVYELRRSKRVHKSTKCGTAGHKIVKHH